MTKYTLVDDIGGTNACLALCDIASGEISQAKTCSGLDYPSPGVVIRVYLEEHRVGVKDGCITIVCPIIGGQMAMTSHTWAFPVIEMEENLGFSRPEVISDLIAVSMTVPMLKKEHLTQSSGAESVKGRPIAVCDAETGLGVAYLVHADKRRVSLPGENSHVNFVPNNEEEAIILEILRVEIGHVSTERALSGPRLVSLCHAIVKADSHLPENPKLKNITERTLADSCTDCHHALSLLCVIIGRFGGNLALSLGTSDGVFIADGIMPRFLEFFKAFSSHTAFEDKGRSKEYVYDIPVYLIAHDSPSLLGPGTYLHQTLGHIL